MNFGRATLGNENLTMSSKREEIRLERDGRGFLSWSVGMAAMLVALLELRLWASSWRKEILQSKEWRRKFHWSSNHKSFSKNFVKINWVELIRLVQLLDWRSRGGTAEDPDLTFTHAHFESRNEVKIEGEGKTIEAINTFIENLKKNEVGTVKVGRSGDEKRKISSGGDKTTFEIEFQLIEEETNKSAEFITSLPFKFREKKDEQR